MHEQIWAKYLPDDGFYPLLAHLLDASSAARILFEQWLRPGLCQRLANDLDGDGNLQNAERAVAVIAGLHDIGKAGPVFQGQKAADPETYRFPGMDKQQAGVFINLCRRNLAHMADGIYNTKMKLGVAKQPVMRRHEQVGAMHFVPGADQNNPLEFMRLKAAEHWLPLVISGHHGRYPNIEKAAETADLRNGPWQAYRGELASLIAQTYDIELTTLINRQVDPVNVVLLSGLVVLADWLASGQDWTTQQMIKMRSKSISITDPYGWLMETEGPMRERIESLLGVFRPLDDARQVILQDWQPRPAQRLAMNKNRGLQVIMAPTGSGKTEAAVLRHEQMREKLLFLLPTMATTNAMMERLKNIYASTGNIASLAHSLAILDDFYDDPSDERAGFAQQNISSLRNSSFVSQGATRLLAPICVGTVDQAVMAGLPLKWTPLRWLALANSHVVIDEVHTLDPYQVSLLSPVLRWLGMTDTRVTFLSATMAKPLLNELAGHYRKGLAVPGELSFPSYLSQSQQEESFDVSDLGSEKLARKTIRFELVSTREKSIHALLERMNRWHFQQRKTFPQARIGIFVNTIDAAQKLALQLLNDPSRNYEVLVLHGRMTAAHRSQVEKDLRELLGPQGKGKAVTVIGTQAIEASLDIDLDFAASILAPAPSLIQRAGRIMRRSDPQRTLRAPGIAQPYLAVFAADPVNNSWCLPYLESVMSRTKQWLENVPVEGLLEYPQMVQSFVETSHLRVEDLTDDADMNEYAQDAQKRMKAQTIGQGAVGFLDTAESGRPVLVDHFIKLTSSDAVVVDDGLSTRYIDRPTASVILSGNTGNIPGLWQGSVAQLENLKPAKSADDRNFVKKALQASVPVSGKVLGFLTGEGQATLLGQNVTPLLRGRFVTEVKGRLQYHPVVGLYVSGMNT